MELLLICDEIAKKAGKKCVFLLFYLSRKENRFRDSVVFHSGQLCKRAEAVTHFFPFREKFIQDFPVGF